MARDHNGAILEYGPLKELVFPPDHAEACSLKEIKVIMECDSQIVIMRATDRFKLWPWKQKFLHSNIQTLVQGFVVCNLKTGKGTWSVGYLN